MAFDHYLREVKENVLTYAVKFFSRFFTATQLTLIGFLFGLIGVYFCFSGNLLLATLFWWLNRIFDGLDGVGNLLTAGYFEAFTR